VAAESPAPLRRAYESGEKEKFDKEMALAMRLPGRKAARTTLAFRSRPYGVSGELSGVLDVVAQYNVRDVADRITTPLYVIDADGDQFFPGQPAELAALVPGSTLVRFTQADGASFHCQPLARELTEQRMLDWMDEQIG
jgi:hypothetical protein